MNKDQRTVVVALGSNKGNRLQHISLAIQLLSKNQAISIVATSNLYQCQAVGFSSGDFINSVIVLDTTLSPLKLLEWTQKIEQKLGRTLKKKRSLHYKARTIDIDLIFYGNILMKTKQLILPHPQFSQRDFVIRPIQDVKKLLSSKGFNFKETKKNRVTKSGLTFLFQETKLIQHQIKELNAK